ncbi:uncharacterized protein LOC114828053 [Galendromus occidentalis]|uniref:Uncharacterized protein LOC114828053 n=1 Tax=Galendromus occidentalis TaxID=34638 RepID=A0AAJ7SEB9_9ACAR|nr:uncharacterized protein LOC114828053 [Galendromus occidentalis]
MSEKFDAHKTIPALQQADVRDPITDEMDNTMLRLLYTFRARHVETVISHFSAQLRDLGTFLQMRANSMLTQFHHVLLERSAYEVQLRGALIKSLMFLNSTPLMDVDTIERMEIRFLEAFAQVGGDPQRWRRIQQTADYDRMSLDEVLEHFSLLSATVRDLKQVNLKLQIELQHNLTDVLQYYITSTGISIEEKIVSQLEDVLQVTCNDLVTLIDKSFRLVKNVIVAGEPIHDHAALEESSLVMNIDDLERVLCR